jgi:hypothetical protein
MTEVLDLTRQYKAALQELREAEAAQERAIANCKRHNIRPPPGIFHAVRRRIAAAQELSDLLFFRLQDYGREVTKLDGWRRVPTASSEQNPEQGMQDMIVLRSERHRPDGGQ